MFAKDSLVKARMKELYNAKLERSDDSYDELFNAIRTFRNLNLISEARYMLFFEYANELYETDGKGYEPKEPKKFDRDMYRDALN